MKKFYIGIDPDTEKSGVAVWDGEKLELHNLGFFELYDFLMGKWRECFDSVFFDGDHVVTVRYELKVVIEAGWLNEKTNWHYSGHSKGVTAQVGARIGANWETGKKIAEMCEYLNLEYELRKPVSSKMDAKFFAKLTGYKGRTNQEQRDAGALVIGLI